MRKMVRHIVLILVPLVVLFLVLPSFYHNNLLLFNFVVFVVLAQGINVIYGFTGYLPFGYVGFFGAGAYGFSLVVLHLHAHPALGMLCGAVGGLVLGVILTPLLRLEGAYFAIASMAASEAVVLVLSNPNLTDITQGPYGIRLSGVYEPGVAYATAVGVLAFTLASVIYLRNSRFGLALQAIRGNPISAAMAGVNVVRARVIAWLLSALIAGLIGAVYAWYISVFYPETVFDLSMSIFAIVFALFGGVATIMGPILGVIILYGVYNGIGLTTPQYFQLGYGILIIALVLFLPNGLLSVLKRWGLNVP